MIIRCLLLQIFMCAFPIVCMSQEPNADYLNDVDGHPISCGLQADVKTMEYITLEGQRINAYFLNGVEFNAGKDSLENYVKKFYYNQEGYDYVELNQRIIFSILFDKKLNIIEVRQIPPRFMRKEELYKRLITNTLKGTTGMWRKTIENKDWYVYWYITWLF